LEWLEVQVECYEGYKSRERPQRLTTKDAVIEIIEVVDRWYEGGVRAGSVVLNYFEVKGSDGKIYLLRYNALFDRWAMAK
jgi:hypothetical protein